MKTIACAAILVLFIMSIIAPWSTGAQIGPAASGVYRFVLDDDYSKSVEFSARSDERGTTTGEMTFTDDAGAPEEDADEGRSGQDEPSAAFFVRASLDSLTIERNRAVMGGTVTHSSNRSYIGKWVQLVVEDNGESREAPDKLTWRLCQPEEGGWIPADAELREDEGAWWRWWATDAERDDDAGVQSPNLIPGTRTGCQILPLGTYDFAEIRSGEGQIQVLP